MRGEDRAGLGDLPLEGVRAGALERAAAAGCEHAEVRVERIQTQFLALRDGHLETAVDDTEVGIGIRVVRHGSMGFAASVDVQPGEATRLVDDAVLLAAATAPTRGTKVELVAEPSHGDVTWRSPTTSTPPPSVRPTSSTFSQSGAAGS